MADATNRQKLINLHTGSVKVPEASILNLGEIAVQHNATDPALYIKTGDNSVAKFVSESTVKNLISGATEEFVALKTELSAVSQTLEGVDVALKSDIDELSGSVETLSASTHSHSNKAVLDGITAEKVEAWDSADENLIEEVKLNGTALTITDKAVDIVLPTTSATGSNHDVSVTVSQDKGAITAVTVSAPDFATTYAAKSYESKVDTIENDYLKAADKTALSTAISANTDNLATLSGQVKTIQDDYLKTSDKTALSGATIAVAGDLKTVSGAVETLSSASHSHTNKALLDTYTQTEENLADAVSKKHEHSNKAELDKITDGDVAKWNSMSSGASVLVSAYTGAEATEGYLKTYEIFQGGVSVGKIDIPKDLVVTSGQIVEENNVKYLRLTIANQSAPVDIPVADLVDAYTEGNGIEISTGNVVSAKVVAANGLSVDANGIAMALATANANGAMSASDFDKLSGVESGAQVNVLEGVQVNGANLTVDANKKVNVTITGGTANGTLAVNGADVAVTGLKSAAFAETTDFDTAGAADNARDAAIASAKSYVDAQVLSSVTGATGDTLVSATVTGKNVVVESTTALTNAVSSANSALQTISKGTDGDYVTTTIGTKANNDQTVGVAVTVVDVEDATGSTKGLAEASDVKAYVDGAVAGKNVSATGDTGTELLIEASASNNQVTVSSTNRLKSAVADAEASLQGLATGKESGASVDQDRKLDLSLLSIDCGTY